MNRKGNEKAIKNSPEEVFETDYVCHRGRALMAVATKYKQVQGCADSFSFLYDVKKIKETKEDDLKTQSMDVHTALSDGDSHDISGVDLVSELRVLREIIPEGTDPTLQALQYIKSQDG
jgi:hypothetical protein